MILCVLKPESSGISLITGETYKNMAVPAPRADQESKAELIPFSILYLFVSKEVPYLDHYKPLFHYTQGRPLISSGTGTAAVVLAASRPQSLVLLHCNTH